VSDRPPWVTTRLALLALAAVLAPVSAPWARVAYVLALAAWIPDWFGAARPDRAHARARRWANVLTVVVLLWLLA
jgi:hypothetical protein